MKRLEPKIFKIRRIFFTIFIVGILIIIGTRVVKHFKLADAKEVTSNQKETIDGVTNPTYGNLTFIEINRIKGGENYLYRVFVDSRGNTVFGREIAGEKEQKMVILYSGLMFIFGFVIAGLNYRFSWIKLSNIVVTIASILFLIAYLLYAEVLRENVYLSRTIEVQENQKVIDTGLYGMVRHPMYAVTILLFLTIPLILGSILSFIIFLVYPIIIIKRIKNEEKVLEKELIGYSEYMEKVKYRLIPFIW